MASRDRPAVYWDACVFISLLKGYTDRSPEEAEGIRNVAGLAERGKLIIVTSQLFSVEVLTGNMPPEARVTLEALFKRRSVQLVPTDGRASAKAQEIREYYINQHRVDRRGKMDAMDALHLGTAIHYKIPEFHTFDDGRTTKTRSLLSLTGNVAGRYSITICKPPVAAQKLLPYPS